MTQKFMKNRANKLKKYSVLNSTRSQNWILLSQTKTLPYIYDDEDARFDTMMIPLVVPLSLPFRLTTRFFLYKNLVYKNVEAQIA